MYIFNELNRLDRLHRMIETHSTGTPDELAGKLNLSRRQLYNVLDELKYLGAEIAYSRNKLTFYYKNNFELHMKLQVEFLDENKRKHIFAGSFSYNAMIMHGSLLSL